MNGRRVWRGSHQLRCRTLADVVGDKSIAIFVEMLGLTFNIRTWRNGRTVRRFTR